MICERQPEPPSVALARTSVSAGKRLRGDLDNIVLMALRQKVERRYGSAEQFAGDLRRYLDGLPVIARPDTFRCRTGKFLRRHKTGVAAAALVLLSLGAGLGAAPHQARIASAHQARAERHFQEVRRLANSLLFEIYDSIQNLPSATPARKLILDRAMQYLDGLYKESAGDSALQRELAWGCGWATRIGRRDAVRDQGLMTAPERRTLDV